MVKLALAVAAAVLLHVVASQPLKLEVEVKPKVSDVHKELDLGSSLTGQEQSEQPLSSESMAFQGDKTPTHKNKDQRHGLYAGLCWIIPPNYCNWT